MGGSIFVSLRRRLFLTRSGADGWDLRRSRVSATLYSVRGRRFKATTED